MKITTLLFLLLGGLGLNAQSLAPEVLANGGGHGSQSNVQLSWTLGELSIATASDPQAVLTQGFHQTNLVITAVEDAFPETWEVQAFPNPVSDVLQIRWTETTQPVHLRFTNISGQVLYQAKVEDAPEAQVQVDRWSQGTYFLEVFDAGGTKGKTFKIEVVRQ